jgi:hypothetical protein
VFTSIEMEFVFRGAGLDPAAIERVIAQADEKVYPVWAMVKASVPITTAFRMVEIERDHSAGARLRSSRFSAQTSTARKLSNWAPKPSPGCDQRTTEGRMHASGMPGSRAWISTRWPTGGGSAMST